MRDENWKKATDTSPEDVFAAEDTDAPDMHAAASSQAAVDNGRHQDRPWSFAPLFLTFMICGFTGGIIPGQNVFVAMLADENVFLSLCSDPQQTLLTPPTCTRQIVYMTRILTLLNAVILAVQLLCGRCFDLFGGQACGILGCVVVALAYAAIAFFLFLVSAAPDFADTWSIIIMVSIAIADTGAWLNNYALMGMVYHYPKHQKLVFALMNAAYQMGSLYAIGSQYIVATFKISLSQVFAGWSVFILLSAVPLRFCVPSHDEYLQEAEKNLETRATHIWKETFFDNVENAWRILKIDWKQHAGIGMTMTLGNVYTTLYVYLSVPYGQELFKSHEAGYQLADIWALGNGIITVALMPLISRAGDIWGFRIFIDLMLVFLVVFSCTVWVQSWTAAAIAVVSNVAYTCVSYMMIGIWFLYFSPPERLGMVTGLYYFLSSMAYIILQFLLLTWISHLSHGTIQYNIPLALAGELAIGSAICFYLAFAWSPPFPSQVRTLESLQEKENGRLTSLRHDGAPGYSAC